MKVARRKRAVSADEIARLADREQDVSKLFTNRGRMMRPIPFFGKRPTNIT
jgi:hypothetical protein